MDPRVPTTRKTLNLEGLPISGEGTPRGSSFRLIAKKLACLLTGAPKPGPDEKKLSELHIRLRNSAPAS
jgi:hypothetical protein